jgi:hypothetical protein
MLYFGGASCVGQNNVNSSSATPFEEDLTRMPKFQKFQQDKHKVSKIFGVTLSSCPSERASRLRVPKTRGAQ